jgi:hypothetical protein
MTHVQIPAATASRDRGAEVKKLSTVLTLGTASVVLELAQMIEPRLAAAMTWYLHTPIKELGYLTARQLVDQGCSESVVAFLKSICRGERD